MCILVEPARQDLVTRYLDYGGGHPDNGQQCDSRPELSVGDFVRSEPEQGQRGGGFDKHRWTDNPRGQSGVTPFVSGEVLFANAGKQRVVNDLYEPDQTRHVQSRSDMSQQTQKNRLVHRFSSTFACNSHA